MSGLLAFAWGYCFDNITRPHLDVHDQLPLNQQNLRCSAFPWHLAISSYEPIVNLAEVEIIEIDTTADRFVFDSPEKVGKAILEQGENSCYSNYPAIQRCHLFVRTDGRISCCLKNMKSLWFVMKLFRKRLILEKRMSLRAPLEAAHEKRTKTRVL